MSNIEWTGKTWNPLSGCTRISAGCQNCYAETMTKRLAAMGQTKYQDLLNEHGRFNGVVRMSDEHLMMPLKTRKPTVWFVNSMSDLFHESVPDEWIDRIFAVMGACDDANLGHVFQILTKRAARMRDYMRSGHAHKSWNSRRLGRSRFPPSNVHLGVSIENQETANDRLPLLLDTPNALPWVSYEPALGPVDLVNYIIDPNKRIQWIVVGGESGPGARRFDVQWARFVVNLCRTVEPSVPVFVKQMGRNVWDRNDAGFEGDEPTEWPMDTETDDWHLDPSRCYQGAPTRIRLSNKKGGDPAEWPEDLRIRQMPEVNHAQ